MVSPWLLAGLTAVGLPDAVTPGAPAVVACAQALENINIASAVAQLVIDKARLLRAQKDNASALGQLRLAAALRPTDAAVLDEWAVAEQQEGRTLLAEQLWLQAVEIDPPHLLARLHYAELLVARGTTQDLAQAAAQLATAQPLAPRDPAVTCLQTRVTALRGLCADADLAVELCKKTLPRKGAKKTLAELAALRGDCRFQLGEYETAEKLFEEAALQGVDVAQRQSRVAEAQKKAQVAPTPERQKAVQDARSLALQVLSATPPDQNLAQALAKALQLAPDVALAHAAIAELALAKQANYEAELAWLRALQLGLGDEKQVARAQAGLGRLYLAWPQHPRAAESAIFLDQAAHYAPLDTALRWDLIQALRGSGQLKRALVELKHYLRDADADAATTRREALALRIALENSIGIADPEPSPQFVLPSGADDVRLRAQKLAGLDRFRDAAALLQEALANGAVRPELQRDLAMYLHGLGEVNAAIAALEASLRGQDGQAEMQALLGRWLVETGKIDKAQIHLARAEQLGLVEVVPLTVRLQADKLPRNFIDDLHNRAQLQDFRTRLDRALVRAKARGLDTPELAEARLLRADIHARLSQAPRALIALIGLGILLLVWFLWRRFGGRDLRYLINAHPETGPEVQRLLAAIRHEVLKHNTLILDSLADAVLRGDAAVALAARDQLLGAGGQDGVADRLFGYVADLQRLGQARGVRLNLQRRDAVMSMLIQGFVRLRRLGRPLGGVQGLSARHRQALGQRLRQIARMLNTDAYGAVRNLLDTIRLLRIDAPMLIQIFGRTRREPALASSQIEPLSLHAVELPVSVLMPRAAFEEVLTNVFRNALQASVAQGEMAIGLRVEVEISPITGLETVVFAVQDQVLGTLTPEQVQNQSIEHGLGLSADLVARYDGGLDVRAESAPWVKAVCIRLPRAFPLEG